MPKNLARRRKPSAARCLLDLLGPPGRRSGCWPHDGEVAGAAVADSTLVISGSGRWPRRSQVRGQLRHDPIATAAALTAIAALTRAREAAPIPASCAEQTDRLEPPGRRCGCWSTSPFLFSGLLLAVWFGATMELGRSMMSAGAGAAQATGSSTTDRKICSTDSGGAYSRSRSAAAARH